MFELRACLTSKCNFKCMYCRPGGEGLFNKIPELSIQKLIKVLKKLNAYGFKSVRLTGGEPFIRKDITKIIDEINNLKTYDPISVVTNGSLLTDKMVKELSYRNIKSITVSLDTFDPNRFHKITGFNSYNTIINNILLLKKYNIPTRINMVVMKDNLDQLCSMIEFCQKNRIDLKLLDLNNLSIPDWEQLYVDFSEILPLIKTHFAFKEYARILGDTGTPMERFSDGKISLYMKNSLNGSTYAKNCLQCSYYPCQIGVSSPVLTHDGKLKLCSISDKEGLNVFEIEEEEQFNEFIKQINFLTEKKVWKHEIEGYKCEV